MSTNKYWVGLNGIHGMPALFTDGNNWSLTSGGSGGAGVPGVGDVANFDGNNPHGQVNCIQSGQYGNPGGAITCDGFYFDTNWNAKFYQDSNITLLDFNMVKNNSNGGFRGISQTYYGYNDYLYINGNFSVSGDNQLHLSQTDVRVSGDINQNSGNAGIFFDIYGLTLNGTNQALNGTYTYINNLTKTTAGILNIASGNFQLTGNSTITGVTVQSSIPGTQMTIIFDTSSHIWSNVILKDLYLQGYPGIATSVSAVSPWSHVTLENVINSNLANPIRAVGGSHRNGNNVKGILFNFEDQGVSQY